MRQGRCGSIGPALLQPGAAEADLYLAIFTRTRSSPSSLSLLRHSHSLGLRPHSRLPGRGSYLRVFGTLRCCSHSPHSTHGIAASEQHLHGGDSRGRRVHLQVRKEHSLSEEGAPAQKRDLGVRMVIHPASARPEPGSDFPGRRLLAQEWTQLKNRSRRQPRACSDSRGPKVRLRLGSRWVASSRRAHQAGALPHLALLREGQLRCQ